MLSSLHCCYHVGVAYQLLLSLRSLIQRTKWSIEIIAAVSVTCIDHDKLSQSQYCTSRKEDAEIHLFPSIISPCELFFCLCLFSLPRMNPTTNQPYQFGTVYMIFLHHEIKLLFFPLSIFLSFQGYSISFGFTAILYIFTEVLLKGVYIFTAVYSGFLHPLFFVCFVVYNYLFSIIHLLTISCRLLFEIHPLIQCIFFGPRSVFCPT